jgi:iron complex outermembrane receptor protein
MGVAYLDAKFDEFVSIDPDRPEEGSLNRAGNVLPRAPEFTLNFAAEYSIPVNSGRLTFRGEYFHRDEMFITQYMDPRARVDAINITNARLSFESEDGHWNAALYGKNLSDEDYPQHIITIQSLLGQVALFAPPKTYGVQFSYDF